MDAERFDQSDFDDCPKEIQDKVMDYDLRVMQWQTSIGEIEMMSDFVLDLMQHITGSRPSKKEPELKEFSLTGYQYSELDIL